MCLKKYAEGTKALVKKSDEAKIVHTLCNELL